MKNLVRLSLTSAFILLVLATTVSGQKPESYVQQGPHNLSAMAFSPDSHLLATADSDGCRIYDLLSNREVRLLRHDEVRAVAFSPDGTLIATAGTDGKSIRSGETPYTVKLWTVLDGKNTLTLSAIDPSTRWKARILSLHFSPDGRFLIGGCERQIAIWKLADRSEPRLLPSPSPLHSTALSSDGKLLAAGCQDGKIRLWDIESGTVLKTLDGHTKSVTALTFSSDDKILASGSYDYVINLWNLPSGTLQRTIKGQKQIHKLSFNSDNKVLASASGYTAILYEVASGAEVNKFGPFHLEVSAVLFSPDNRVLAGASYDGRLVLWDRATAKPIRTFERRHDEITSVDLLFDNKMLAVETGTNTQVWDYQAGEYNRTVEARMASIFFGAGGAYSSDFKLAAIADAVGGVTVVDVEAKKELRKLSGHELFVSAVAFGQSDKLIATGGADGIVKLWEAASGRLLHTINTNPEEKKIAVTSGLKVTDPSTMFKNIIGALAFSPDGKILASVVHGASDGDSLRLWDSESGRLLRSMPGNADFISAIAFDSVGKRLASGDLTGVIKVWDVEKGTELSNLSGHAGRVSSLRFAPREVLISGGWDAKVKLWDLTEKRELASLISDNRDEWLVITPDGLFDGSPYAWKEILWRFSPTLADIVPVELFFSEYFYPNLLSDILSGSRPRAAQDIRNKDRRQPGVRLTVAKSSAVSEPLSERNITLNLEVTEASGGGINKGSGARDLRLFRNGSLVRVWRGALLSEGNGERTFQATVPIVTGENRFTAYVFNDDGIKSADATAVIKGAESLQRLGTAYVIAMGVNEYENSQFNLRYAVPDAESFGAELRRAQEELKSYKQIEVVPLLDRTATKANLLKALARLAGTDRTPLPAGDPLQKLKPTEPEDVVMVYFSGHGTAQGNRFYLIPHDLGYKGKREELGSDANALRTLLSHSISDVELEESFEKIDAAHLLLVIDACHSGQALEAEEKRRGPMNSKGLAQLAYEKGMYVLTAAQSYQVAIGSGKLGHGYLTYALVGEGLKAGQADSAPKDGQVLLREWLDYAVARVPQMQEEGLKEMKDLVQPPSATKGKPGEAQALLDDGVQRPRVFYRREAEAQPLVVAKP